MRHLLEICVDRADGARAAIAGGADRIELCSALALGGLTPSAGLVARVVADARSAGVRVHAMVRPRPGDFAYGPDMLATADAEGAALIAAGVDGLVFGAVRDDALDQAALADFVAAMRARREGIDLTLHRAVDLLPDPAAAVEPAIALGFDRILSSGGAVRAADGTAVLRRMVARAAGRIAVQPGSGITAAHVADILSATGARELHASAGTTGAEPDARVVALGFAAAPPRRTDQAAVAALRAAIDAAARQSSTARSTA